MTKRDVQMVLCGLGGQGVVFLSRILAEAAMLEGREVLTAETHGMAQRGAAVESHVKMGGFQSSLVRQGSAHAVLVLDPGRLASARRFLGPLGAGFLNAEGPVTGADVCDAAAIAREIGFPRGLNLVLLGFASAERSDLFPAGDTILQALRRISPAAACEENVRAFEAGRRGNGVLP